MELSKVLETIDSGMYMKNANWLEDKIASNKNIFIIDFRSKNKVKEERIKGSVQLDIRDLPGKVNEMIPNKDTTVVCVCNGSIQSAMAVVYLRSEDYVDSWNLSGGLSSWVRNNRETVKG